MATPARRPRAKTIEARENRLISLAVDLAERQLADGSASSQIVSHFLRLATTREALEKEKIRKEIILASAKAEAIQSAKRFDELCENAMNALRSYRSSDQSEEEPYDQDI